MIDLAAVTAIDVHVHTELARDGHDPMPPELRQAAMIDARLRSTVFCPNLQGQHPAY